jgi:hypothetical protein
MRRSRATAAVAVAAIVTIVAAFFAFERQKASSMNDRAISGELVRYDVSSRSLTVRTEHGEGRFVVASGVPVHAGAKTIALADLGSARGWRVKIRYREKAGQRTVHEIRISRGRIDSTEPTEPTEPTESAP